MAWSVQNFIQIRPAVLELNPEDRQTCVHFIHIVQKCLITKESTQDHQVRVTHTHTYTQTHTESHETPRILQNIFNSVILIEHFVLICTRFSNVTELQYK